MDRQEARLILQAYRPNGADALDPDFVEALEVVDRDPELRAWWKAQHAFDSAVAEKLERVRVPENLRDLILQGRPVTTPPAPPPRLLGLLAIAACVAILCVAGAFKYASMAGPVEQEEYTTTALGFLKNDAPDLAMQSSDRAKLVAWLRDQHAPMGTIPGKLADMTPVGCQKYEVHGHMVSLLCFDMGKGKIAHLFVVEQDAIEDASPTSAPVFRDDGKWRTAAWSDGKMTYLLATTADADALKQLL